MVDILDFTAPGVSRLAAPVHVKPWVHLQLSSNAARLPMELLRTIKRWLKGDTTRSGARRGTVGVLAIMKNETAVLREWIEHYKWQGVDRIFLIDNGSSDSPLDLLRDDIAAGLVEFYSRTERHQQASHYRAVFMDAKIRSKVEWLVMADLDEFWYSPLGDLKKAIAAIQDNHDLIYANWIMFGSSGLVEQPASIREAFVHRWRELCDDTVTKWICRTRAITQLSHLDIHKVGGIDSKRVVIDNTNCRLNHYPLMSREHFQRVKMTRGSACPGIDDNFRDMEYFNNYDRLAVVVDTTLADLTRGRRRAQRETNSPSAGE